MIRLLADVDNGDDPPRRRRLDVIRYDSPRYLGWVVWSVIIGLCLVVWLAVILIAVAVLT